MRVELRLPVPPMSLVWKGARIVSRTVIQGGLVITAADEIHADVLVEDGRVAALAAHGSPTADGWAGAADRVIDATGKYVVPGGVDAHTHMELPFGGTFSSDNFETGTRAAAWGGTTTIVDFAVQTRGESLRDGLDAWHAKADGKCAIDYAFHMILSDVNERHAQGDGPPGRRRASPPSSCSSPTPASSTSTTARSCAPCSAPPTTAALIMMHAENGIAIDVLVEQALAEGETDPRYHGEVRRVLLEAEATHRAIQLARVAGAPLYIVHVSARRPSPRSPQARDKGLQRVRRDLPAVLFRPPTISPSRTSRAPSTCAPRRCGQGAPGGAVARAAHQRPPGGLDRPLPVLLQGAEGLGRGDFSKIPNGMPGVENRMDLLHQGVVDGQIAAAAGSRSPAPPRPGCSASSRRKGTIAVGSDADIVIYDPHRERTVSARPTT